MDRSIGSRARRVLLTLAAFAAVTALISASPHAEDQAPAVVKIGFLGERVKRAAPEPYLDPPPPMRVSPARGSASPTTTRPATSMASNSP